MTELPPKPSYGILETPDLAKARAVDKLTDGGEPTEMLSTISGDDVPRLNFLLTLGHDEDLDFDLPAILAHNELRLQCSVPAKKSGIRSEQITEIVKDQPPIMDSQGFFGKARDKILRR
jgi:hypothetical protein